MQRMVEDYFGNLKKAMDAISVTGQNGETYSFPDGVVAAVELINKQSQAGRRLMFIGNGASASIASHMATDFTKAGGKRATAFNDGALLTCIGNDFGYEYVFQKPIEFLADPGDILFAISSSGNSENIHNGVKAARERGCHVVTFSGFKEDNPLRDKGDLNFHVPFLGYGPVEILHHAICHCILDTMIMNQQANS
ncbi:D-sedoheptulose-7-phosphate isomerase [Nitrospina watsonii]|uniref:Sugar isomerase (SIS) n=1 Tax=Nitrospina watsonii TaxID=1323948 RepID=A0ABN8VYV2_9BACT|nr:SIS domain-containing protein [Nitrospina watsonii]CAI2717039.1 Sugar isomerase (SIS) [Nitrospina watsonii]